MQLGTEMGATLRAPDRIETNEKSAERRRASRTRILKSAKIVFNDSHCSMDCQVCDLTEAGARLRPADILLCPEEFTLKLRRGAAYKCEVKWRKGRTLGVVFATHQRTA